MFNILADICKSQRDIEVANDRAMRERKEERDSMKRMHEHFGIPPPRSPISPVPPKAEILSVDEDVGLHQLRLL
jgi:hypothetical protein